MPDDFGHRTHWPAPERGLRRHAEGEVRRISGRDYEWTGTMWKLLPEKGARRGRQPEVKRGKRTR